MANDERIYKFHVSGSGFSVQIFYFNQIESQFKHENKVNRVLNSDDQKVVFSLIYIFTLEKAKINT